MLNQSRPSGVPIRSRYAEDPEMSELVEWFVGELPGRMAELSGHAEAGRTDEVRRIAHQLRGSGSAYGFDEITRVAQNLEHAITGCVDVSAEADAIRKMIDELVETCRRAVF